ncbi:trypsin-like peptidase domain-containing protein [Streptomyces sp. INA 01156]
MAAGATPSEAANRDAAPDRERAREADGDFELARPAAPATTPGRLRTAPAPEPRGHGSHDGHDSYGDRWGSGDRPSCRVVEPAGAGYGVGQTEQPRPLHDPDPYSTPPYGEPGPWAPAPPVQHPAALRAGHGGPAPAPHPAPDTPAPARPPGHRRSHRARRVRRSRRARARPPGCFATDAPAATDVTAAADPWQRYDPWAAPAAGASAPLQQTGVAEPTKDQRRKRAGGGSSASCWWSRSPPAVSAESWVPTWSATVVWVPWNCRRPGGARRTGTREHRRIAARALPSVVTLHVSGAGSAGTGTGFVLDGRGHILTNDHVVQPAGSDGEITVTFHSGDTAKATLVGRDSGYDLAVVKVKGVSGLDPCPSATRTTCGWAIPSSPSAPPSTWPARSPPASSARGNAHHGGRRTGRRQRRVLRRRPADRRADQPGNSGGPRSTPRPA